MIESVSWMTLRILDWLRCPASSIVEENRFKLGVVTAAQRRAGPQCVLEHSAGRPSLSRSSGCAKTIPRKRDPKGAELDAERDQLAERAGRAPPQSGGAPTSLFIRSHDRMTASASYLPNPLNRSLASSLLRSSLLASTMFHTFSSLMSNSSWISLR